MENNSSQNYSSVTISTEESLLPEWTKYSLISLMVVIATVGIPCNAFVIFTLQKLCEKTSTDTYVCTMAVSDFISSFLCTACYIIRYEQRTWDVLASRAFCRLHVFLLYVTSVFSTSLVAIIAHDRFKSASSGNSSMTLQRHAVKKAKRNCAIVAIASILYGSTALFRTSLDENTHLCSLSHSHVAIGYVSDTVLVLAFMVMFAVTAFCYTKIQYLLKKHDNNRKKLREESVSRRAVRKLSVLFRQHSENFKRLNTLTLASISEGHENSQDKTGKPAEKKPPGSSLAVMHGRRSLQINNYKFATINVQLPDMNGSGVTHNDEHSRVQSHFDRRLEQIRADTCRDRRRKNRTASMMFLITFIFISTWVISWIASIIEISLGIMSLELLFLLKKMYMINNMTNPFLHALMSSKFREHAMKLFRKT